MDNSRTMGWREMLQQAIDEASRVGQGPDALRYIGQVTADRLSYGPTNRPVVAQVERKQEPAMELRPQGGQPRNRRRDLGMDPDQDYKCTICNSIVRKTGKARHNKQIHPEIYEPRVHCRAVLQDPTFAPPSEDFPESEDFESDHEEPQSRNLASSSRHLRARHTRPAVCMEYLLSLERYLLVTQGMKDPNSRSPYILTAGRFAGLVAEIEGTPVHHLFTDEAMFLAVLDRHLIRTDSLCAYMIEAEDVMHFKKTTIKNEWDKLVMILRWRSDSDAVDMLRQAGFDRATKFMNAKKSTVAKLIRRDVGTFTQDYYRDMNSWLSLEEVFQLLTDLKPAFDKMLAQAESPVPISPAQLQDLRAFILVFCLMMNRPTRPGFIVSFTGAHFKTVMEDPKHQWSSPVFKNAHTRALHTVSFKPITLEYLVRLLNLTSHPPSEAIFPDAGKLVSRFFFGHSGMHITLTRLRAIVTTEAMDNLQGDDRTNLVAGSDHSFRVAKAHYYKQKASKTCEQATEAYDKLLRVVVPDLERDIVQPFVPIDIEEPVQSGVVFRPVPNEVEVISPSPPRVQAPRPTTMPPKPKRRKVSSDVIDLTQ